MGINPTPTNHRSFTFDGKSTREFGVYITGEGVFNAPERAVEMISIPGRDGEYALDQGHFNNIEVTYRAGIVSYDTDDFAEAVSDFRNWLASRRGYCRLTDEYNPDEYRMAVFKNVIAVEHEGLETGEFDVVFNCKPQRWLTSGETSVAVTSGGTITNPTLFDAEPLLAVEGYGNISFNGFSIDVNNTEIGLTKLINAGSLPIMPDGYSLGINLPYINNFDTGDSLYISGMAYNYIQATKSPTEWIYKEFTLTNVSGCDVTVQNKTTTAEVSVRFDDANLLKGTSKTWTASFSVDVTLSPPNSATTYVYTDNYVFEFRFYAGRIEVDTSGGSVGSYLTKNNLTPGLTYPTQYGYSSLSALGNPTYIDCDIGEAYMLKNGEIITLNDTVALGSDLPKLSTGANEFTYDNTVTGLTVTPRWWKI